MSGANWLQVFVLVGALLITAPLLGVYLARVLGGGAAPGDRFFLPVERVLYRVAGVDPDREQPWNVYALSLLAFSAVSVVGLYLLERVQGVLPLNPTDVGGVPSALAFNTAASFATNTNWQNYAGESTMSHLTQMAGLTVQNFVSAAVGIAVAVALVRGLIRRRSATIGNFWVDLTRVTVRVLVPLAAAIALLLASQGVVQSLRGPAEARTVEGASQSIYRAPIASQEAIKELGTNGGGIANANSAHPFENPTAFTNLVENWALLAIPFALAFAFGRLVGDRRQGYALFAAMFVLWIASAGLAMHFELDGNPRIEASAPNMEGKEVRFGAAASGLFAASTTGTSTGAVIASHDSFTPLGGAVPLANMMLGEVSPGGVRNRVRVDLDELEQLLHEAGRTEGHRRMSFLVSALALFRDEPLAGSDFAWSEGEIRRLRGIYVGLLEEVGRACLEAGDPRQALTAAERGIETDLLNEGFWRLALEVEGQLGLREGIEERYERLRTLLDDRLGLEPAPETRRLYLRLLGPAPATGSFSAST